MQIIQLFLKKRNEIIYKVFKNNSIVLLLVYGL